VRPDAKTKSKYENYDIEQRLHYIDKVQQLVREICLQYIASKNPQER
jgi:hypothetical protein